ncbi:MAG TPA: hypothetical protein PKK74_04645 [Candidatus Methanoculleus thermohydrogenotrophicum]|nr:hypothetical protein [Candidatus Methanoculleus thermohydrogenotrophicum]HPZ38108.1 hypothetical protein [Candidatus Methanoculleus thermohydrogenotrophicum]HQC91320.1 hypothetical protein [Candidatus Methanoculleus thermohydrogenotrophicum]
MLETAAIEVDAVGAEVPGGTARLVPQPGDVYDIVEIKTDQRTTTCRYHGVEGTSGGIVMVDGAGGGFETPARGPYPPDLPNRRISALRVRYRRPTDLVESTVALSREPGGPGDRAGRALVRGSGGEE